MHAVTSPASHPFAPRNSGSRCMSAGPTPTFVVRVASALPISQTMSPTLRSPAVLLSLACAISAAAQTAVAVNPAATAAVAAVSTVATSATVAVPAATITPTVQPPRGSVALTAATGETSVTLDVGFGIRAVLPSRLTVPVGEMLRITAPDMGTGVTYIWTKDGRALAGTSGPVLTLGPVLSDDAATYVCLFSTPTTLPAPSQSLILGVGPTARLLNLSTRTVVGPGPDQSLVSGFVVAAGSQPKKLILRAIGPSLASFGVTNALRAPVLKIYDSAGRAYENGYAYPAVVGGLTYEADLAGSLARTGAFPIPAGTRDAVLMMPFPSGSYTAQVTSGDGTAGTVLLEIYEVP